MRPVSMFVKRCCAGVIGLLYAVLYGFWTMFITGGGHVNFIWLALFVFVEFFGLYFPLMAVLAVNLRKNLIKIVFGSLIAFNLIASVFMIIDWITEPGAERPSDFSRTLHANGYTFTLFFAAIHFLPTIVFAILLMRSILRGKSPDDNHELSSLQLS